MHRTATAAALAAAAGFTALTAGPAAADTPAPSPTALPTWTIVHPTYEQQPAVTLPPPAPSPVTPGPVHAAPPAAQPQPRRPRATAAPARRTPAHHRAPRNVHRHHAPTMRVGHTTYRAGSGKWLVVDGETLTGIAGIFDVTVEQLARANGITNPDRIYAGQWLTIPAGAR